MLAYVKANKGKFIGGALGWFPCGVAAVAVADLVFGVDSTNAAPGAIGGIVGLSLGAALGDRIQKASQQRKRG